jgi:hypothetical protein
LPAPELKVFSSIKFGIYLYVRGCTIFSNILLLFPARLKNIFTPSKISSLNHNFKR